MSFYVSADDYKNLMEVTGTTPAPTTTPSPTTPYPTYAPTTPNAPMNYYAPTTYAPTTYAPTTYAPTTYAPTTYAPTTTPGCSTNQDCGSGMSCQNNMCVTGPTTMMPIQVPTTTPGITTPVIVPVTPVVIPVTSDNGQTTTQTPAVVIGNGVYAVTTTGAPTTERFTQNRSGNYSRKK